MAPSTLSTWMITAAAVLMTSSTSKVSSFQIPQQQKRQQQLLLPPRQQTSNAAASSSGGGQRYHRNSASLLSMIATNKNQQEQLAMDAESSSSSSNNKKKNKKNKQKDDSQFVADIIQDGRGHINPELARKIYKWEQDQRLNLNLPRFRYSTREGLRWVLECVQRASNTNNNSNSNMNKQQRDEDLLQEGVIALMEAMTQFERKAPSHVTFETYCKSAIQQALQEYRQRSATPAQKGNGKSTLSVESTIKIDDPLETHYSNQEEWEVREGLVLDNGRGVKADELVEDFLDESLKYEGEDQMWVHQQQVAAPLTDSIPDDNEYYNNYYDDDDNTVDNDATKSTMDAAGSGDLRQFLDSNGNMDNRFLADMIRFNVDEFLGSTLNETEAQVIQMRFGLGEEPMTQKEVAFELNLSIGKVRKIQKLALEKLRNAYIHRYVNDNSKGSKSDNDDDDDEYVLSEDSV